MVTALFILAELASGSPGAWICTYASVRLHWVSSRKQEVSVGGHAH